MPSVTRSSALDLATIAETADNLDVNVLLNSLKSARGKGLSLDDFLEVTSVAHELNERWEQTRLGSDLVRSLCELDHAGMRRRDRLRWSV
jgi:hypothetical protein